MKFTITTKKHEYRFSFSFGFVRCMSQAEYRRIKEVEKAKKWGQDNVLHFADSERDRMKLSMPYNVHD